MDGLIGHLDMARHAVGVREDRNRRHPHTPGRVDHPASDLAPVGNQDLAEHATPFRQKT
jgi:hypothetical protein